MLIHTVLRFIVLFMASLFLHAAAAGAEIQKWVDENGKVHYGERAPSSDRTMEFKNQVSIVKVANTVPVATLYSTKWCGYCKKARAFMDRNGIRYREIDIERSTVDNKRYKQLGGKGVPFLVRGGETVQGFSETTYKAFFDVL